MSTDFATGEETPGTQSAAQDASPDFLSSLSEADKALATERGWTDSRAVFDEYRALEGQLSGTVALPGEGAHPEEVSAFYGDVARHWTPKNGYSFKMPEGLAESFPYDEAFAKEAGSWFQEAGLPPHVAQTLHDKWVGKMAGFHEQSEAHRIAEAERTEADASAAHDALVKEFGEPDSQGYQNLIEKALRAQIALQDDGVDVTNWFAEKGLLSDPDEHGQQQVLDATAVKLLAFVHDRALTEDGVSLGDGSEGGNPFDSNTPDLARQDMLLRTNPGRARALIMAAGREPALFAL